MKFFLGTLAVILLGLSACGTEMTVSQVEETFEAPSSPRNTGDTSGTTYSTGGEYYEIFQNLGSSFGTGIQKSTNGKYTVK